MQRRKKGKRKEGRGGKRRGEARLDETDTQVQIRSGHQDKPSGVRCRVSLGSLGVLPSNGDITQSKIVNKETRKNWGHFRKHKIYR